MEKPGVPGVAWISPIKSYNLMNNYPSLPGGICFCLPAQCIFGRIVIFAPGGHAALRARKDLRALVIDRREIVWNGRLFAPSYGQPVTLV